MKLALFDFDGTITTKDSLPDFIQHAIGKRAYFIGVFKLSPMLTAYKLKLIKNDVAKEIFISHFFSNWDEKSFNEIAEQYAANRIDKITRPKAMKKILWHLEQDHKVVIVSASMESWLRNWCDKHNIELLSTRLEVKNGRLTGKFATKNCYGLEKEERVREQFDLQSYEYIYAYGDSPGDKELLALADEAHYKPFQ